MRGVDRASCDRRDWLARPGMLVALLTVGAALLAVLIQANVMLAPPVDVIDAHAAGPDWRLGTHKHPNMPVWLLELSRLATGAIGWPAYVLGRLSVVLMVALVYVLGRDLVGAPRAAVAVLVLAAVEYFSWRSYNFNHNLVQLPFWAATGLMAWRAVARDRLGWWIGLGAVAAGGVYCKLSFVVLLAAVAAWLVADPVARRRWRGAGPYVAFAVFLLLVAPLAFWLTGDGVTPLTYVQARIGSEQTASVAQFFAGLVARGAPVAALLGLALLVGGWRPGPLVRRTAGPAASGSPTELPEAAAARAVRFLGWLAVGPFALVVAIALVTGTRINATWMVPAFVFAGLLVIASIKLPDVRRALAASAVAAGVLAVVLPIAQAVSLYGPGVRDGVATRSLWPYATIRDTLRERYAAATGQPVRIVAGREWTASLVAVDGRRMAQVLPRGERALVPWLDDAQIRRDGMLIVWDNGAPPDDFDRPPPGLEVFAKGLPVGEARFAVPRARRNAEIVIRYVIVPPER